MNLFKLGIEKMILVATTFVVATVVFSSCKKKLETISSIDRAKTPTQTVTDMSLQQISKSRILLNLEAPLMESYGNAPVPYEIFPKGVDIRAFTEDGLIETEIKADVARHFNSSSEDKWEACGNVVINNYIKGEVIRTDTLYWDRLQKRIYTHRWVKISAPQYFMQGTGLESDELVRNAEILNPYDSDIMVTDSSRVAYRDTVNFVGPVLPKTIRQR